MIKELLKDTRSYRRYDEKKRICREDLLDIAEAVRFCPSAANMQRIRLALVTDEKDCESVFNTLAFAAYLRPWVRPEVGERPVAYIVIMTASELDANLAIDVGIAAEAMMLTARERGIVGCMFRSFNKENLTRVVRNDGFIPALVISLGYAGEQVVIEDAVDGNVRYYRDEKGVHHVPKLPLDEIIL